MENSPEDMSVLLQFAKFSRGFRITDFDEFVQNFIGFEKLDFFGRLAYPNQWQIRLTDPNLRESLIRAGRTRIKNRSCWIYPLNKQEIRGFVHWLPNSVTNDQLKEYLQQYGNVLFVESQERSIQGQNIESDHRYYGLILPHGTIKEDLPHFLKINGFMCLVVVRGREPACYHCKEVGHRRAECPKYKSKLISYCNREPNTAPPRLRPRGRRHEKAETEVGAESGRSEVTSSDDIVPSERPPFAESITEPRLPAPADRQHAIETHGEAATGSTANDFEKGGVLAQRKEKSCTDSSGASFSEAQTSNLEIIQKIQLKFMKNLQQGFKNVEKEISLVITRGSQSIDTRDQRQSTAIEATCINVELGTENVVPEMQAKEVYAPEESTALAEMTESDSNAGMDIQETGSVEIPSDLPTLLQVDSEETVETSKKSEENPQCLQSPESSAKDSTSNADISPALRIIKEARQGALEISEDTHKKLGEFLLNIKAHVEPSKDSATDTVPKLTEEDGQVLLNMLKNLKAITTEPSSFKKIEANLYSQLSGESIDSESNLTEEDIYFAKQMWEKTKENVAEIVQNTVRKLEEKVVEEVTKQFQIATESTTESEATPKIAQPDATLEQPKQDADIAMHISQQTLDAAMENVSGILQNTFKNLEENVVRIEQQSRTTTASATESGAIPKITSTATQHDSTSEQRKQKILDAMRRERDRKSEAAKENEEIVQSASKSQEAKVVQVAEQSGTATEIATESKATLKISSIATQPGATFEQPKQDIDTAQPIYEKNIEVAETKPSEKASIHCQSLEETFQTESDSLTIVHEDLEATPICEPSEVTTAEEAFAERKEPESNISKAVQEDLEKLQTDVKKIFASFEDRAADSEAITILKQVESEVIEVVEETTCRWKKEH